MFYTFFAKELKAALKQPMIYIFLALISLLTFAAVVSNNVSIGGAVGNVYKNAPHIISIYTIILSFFGLLTATAFFNNAALRDYANNFDEILFSAPLSKSGYFFGRFFGALVLSTIPLLGVFIGIIIGSYLGPIFNWISPDRIGGFQVMTFVKNYFIFILPNMFIAGAIIFGMANKWKSTVISFVGSLLIVIGYSVSSNVISDLENQSIAALVDVFGMQTYIIQTKYYTAIEKNTLNPIFSGLLLVNRAIWIGFAIIILLTSFFSFSFHKKNKKEKALKKKIETSNTVFTLPEIQQTFTMRTHWTHFKSFFFINFLSIFKNVTFKILLLFSLIILISNLISGYEYYGLQSYPVTYKIMDTIKSAAIFIFIIIIFFSGELIWRDRDYKINEVIDATPHTSIISLVAKTLSLVAIASILRIFFIICGILYQLAKGYYRIDLNTYILDFLYVDLSSYFIFSGIMILIQVLCKNKYIGYFISILLLFISDTLLYVLNIESNMMYIGGRPSLLFSDMNSFGPSLKRALWFNTYWLLLSTICLSIAGLLWNRGKMESFKNRVSVGLKQISTGYKIFFLGIITTWLFVAGFVYYNTQIVNKMLTADEIELSQVDYEKKYKKFEKINLPKLKDINYFVDIFPYKRNVIAKAKATLANESNTAIDSIHFNLHQNWETEILIPDSELVLDDKELGYQIYKLNKPLQPNQEIPIEINVKYLTKGFENNNELTSIVANGTFLNNITVFPNIGYSSGAELSDKNTRKKYGLPKKEIMPKLQANCSTHCMRNYISNGTSDFTCIETVISTTNDQIAIAPGTLVKKWTANNRTYFHYQIDHPSLNFVSFVSGKYKIKKRDWNGIPLEVYYDEKHPQNLDKMLDAVENSLTYYTKNFGPYMHDQCRIIEFPRYSTFAQAFPGTMPYSESFGFIVNLEDENKNNIVDAVIAHEMAHQWWAHQVIGADMQGATLFSEGFSEYASLMVMKKKSDTPMKMREFLKYDHERYLRGRSGELNKELPIYKVEANQQYIHYGKSSVALYALQDYIGEDKVNIAMRNFLNEFKYKKPPYPTSLDFLEYLEPQVPDSLNYLVTDLLKTITLYDNRIKEATYKKTSNGKYQISMKVATKKIRVDTIGVEKSIPINDWIDLGAFGDTDEKNLIFEKRVKITKPEMDFSFEIDTIPAKLAIDPKRLLIDRVYKDNSKTVEEISL